MDQGGKLYSNPDILNVFTNHHYEVNPTGTDFSHQNGPLKRAHRVIGDHVRALLISADLGIKFWPYAFFHHLRIQNTMAMNGQNSSCIFQTTGKKENLSGFRTFGCQTCIRPPSKRTARLKEFFLVSFLELSETSCGTIMKQATLDPLTTLNLMKV